MSYVMCLYCGEETHPNVGSPTDGEECECECENCGRKMQVACEIVVDFTPFCIEDEHDFETKRHNSVMWDECKRCGAMENVRESEAAQ